MMRIVLAIAVGLLFIFIGGRETIGSLRGILNSPAAAMVLFFATVTTLIQVNFSQLVQSYFARSKNEEQSEWVYQLVGRNFLFAGLFGSLLGFLRFASVAPNPDLIGPAVAFSYTSLTYGAVGYLFFCLCFLVANERALERTDERDTHIDLKNRFFKIAAFAVVLIASAYLSDFKPLEPFAYSAALVFVASPVALKIACRHKINDQTDRFQQGVITGGLLMFIVGLMHALANLSQKEKVYSALSIGSLAVIFTLSALYFFKYHSAKNGRNSIHDERVNELSLVWKYFISTLVIASIEFGAVIYVVLSLPK